jgi:hypothetical protein
MSSGRNFVRGTQRIALITFAERKVFFLTRESMSVPHSGLSKCITKVVGHALFKTYEFQTRKERMKLFDGYRFCQVPRHVRVVFSFERHEVGQELQRDHEGYG